MIVGMKTVSDIIAIWDSAEDLGRSINEPGLKVRMWRHRNSIPPRYWPDIIAAAKARGVILQADDFLQTRVAE